MNTDEMELAAEKTDALLPTPPVAAITELAQNVGGGRETAGMVLASQAKALIEARYTIALRMPRDLDLVRSKLMRECKRPGFAEVAIYRKPVGKGIEGPSVRFAEAAVQIMGNILQDTPTVYDDAEKRIVRVTVADMETNVAYSQDVTVMKRVERRSLRAGEAPIRVRRAGSDNHVVYTVEATDDEILNTQGALISKAFRNIALRLVPGWLVEECMTACRATRKKSDAEDPDSARRKLFDAFDGIGVSADQVKAFLGHDPSVLSAKEHEELKGLYVALKQDEITWAEVMEEKGKPASPAGPKSANAAVKEQAKKEAAP